jgi:hypothetical protein
MILGNSALNALSLKAQVQVQEQVPQVSIMFIMQLMQPEKFAVLFYTNQVVSLANLNIYIDIFGSFWEALYSTVQDPVQLNYLMSIQSLKSCRGSLYILARVADTTYQI